jgi:predicted amino acid racemase
VGAIVKAVVTIEALNRPLMVATVSGPNGNFVSIPMEDEKLITELHIGEVLVLTYAEAVAVSLEKMEVED